MPPAATPRPERPARRGVPLWVLLLGTATLLVLLMQWAVVSIIVPQVEKATREAIDDSLRAAGDVWARRSAERMADRAKDIGLLVKDQGYLELINPEQPPAGGLFGDEYRPTLVDALDQFGRRAGYAFVVVGDHEGRLLMRHPATLLAREDSLRQVMRSLSSGLPAPRGKERPVAAAIVALGGDAYRVAVVDMGTADQQRWLMMGFALEPELVALRSDMRAQASIVRRDGAAPLLVDSTLEPGADRDTLRDAAADAVQVAAPEHVWRLRTVALEGTAGQALELRLARPLDSAEAAAQAMRKDLWSVGGVAIAGFALLLWLTAHFLVTKDLSALVRQARQVGRQEYDVGIVPGGPVREVRELGRALDQMRGNLRDEQYFDRRLTQLPNRAHFRHELDRAIREQRPVTVLLVGLNRFKEINRRLGYSQGDGLLKAMALRLQQVVRPGDFVARLGGDLFAVLLPTAEAADVKRAAERIGHELEQPLDLDGHRVDRTAAIGAASAPLHAVDGEALLARAEVALYTAKDRREAHVVYDPAFDRESKANLALLSELRHALANRELRLHLQPKVNLHDGRLAGAEALLRWEHPLRKLVPPGDFIPYAEDSPIIKDLTLWVFEAVIEQQKALRAIGIDSVSINLSARDLMDLDLPRKLGNLLAKHGADGRGLCLETTESAVMGDYERALQTLRQLRDHGFKLSIDDFGEGQTSMRYLKDLPVHELKIDMVFVKGMQADPRNESIVRALAEVGHQYGLTVVAEGVETAAVAQRLAELGCDEGQGWHYGKAMPVGELAAWVQRHEERLAAAH